jgi:thiol:disulfide interchange protein
MRPVVFLLVVFVSVFAVVGVSKWWMPKELVPWQSDFAAAQAAARDSNRPILLYFTASWCAPCQQMRRYVWTDPRVADAAAAYQPVRIDIDQNPQLAVQFNAADAIPVLIVLDVDGKILRRIDYALDADNMVTWLNSRRAQAGFGQ